MDLEEIGSLLIMIVLAVVSGLVKRKKKQRKQVRKKHIVNNKIEVDNYFEDDLEMASEEVGSTFKNDSFDKNSSKSEPYFTYEEVRVQETDYAQKNEPIAESKTKDNLQDSENEEETNCIDFSDPQELRKAVIYKEILERPYN